MESLFGWYTKGIVTCNLSVVPGLVFRDTDFKRIPWHVQVK